MSIDPSLNIDPVERHKAWLTRVVGMVCVCVLVAYAMFLQIDGVMIPVLGVAIISGIAGYETGAKKILERYPDGGIVEKETNDAKTEE